MSTVAETMYGRNAAAVIDRIKGRASGQGTIASPGLSRKLALIVEGGAMRGVISCGALLALEELGFTQAFDEVYGASAGAINAAYFLAGQAAYATAIYYHDINNNRFIRTPWRRRFIDLDHLFDTIIARERRLRVDQVLKSPSQFFISIADAESGDALLVHAQTSSDPLLTLLKASGAMPLLYNGFVTVNGRPCFDGGMLNPLPITEAIERGCTDILVLMTRPPMYRSELPTNLERRLFETRCARGNPRLIERFMEGYMRHDELQDIALGRTPIPEDINIATICPSDDEPHVERMTTEARLLKAAAISSARRTFAAFGHDVEEFVEVLRPFPHVQRVEKPLAA